MNDPEDDLRTDLEAITAWLDSVYPEHAPVVLVSALQDDAAPDEVGLLMADYGGAVHYSGPVVQDAQRALSFAGWRINLHRRSSRLSIVTADSNGTSSHAALEALARFRGI